ncbi:hypothetical protein BTVI_23609 [Pitangus sulphuratus]|nr:hypothetical protein BTVI_23609 [Pitangus sulphuratus]
MAEGPRQLLEVCGQRLARFLHDAQHKRLAWLREVEEQGVRMLERLSRRRSSVKPVSSRLSSQQHLRQEQPRSPGCGAEEVPVPSCAPGSQAGVTPQLLELPVKQLAEAFIPSGKQDCQDCVQGAVGGDAAPLAVLGKHLPEGDAAAELQEVSGVTGIAAEQPGRDGEQEPRTASTSTPKAAQNGDPAVLQGDGSPQGLKKLLFQDSDSKRATEKSRLRRRSKSRRVSLAEKYSLSSRRESMIRRSIGRAMARKAAARESSSASSRVSCQSSLEIFVEEDMTSSTRPELEENPPREKVVKPLKNFLQAVQRNQLLQSPGPTGRGGGIKDFIKRNTPTRPNLKEKERQRLENLRKKQEAEEQRKKKVEEEKRRRQAEMKQKREERLRKALQARERVEQREEEKKKRMEQKILQSDEKVYISQVREEKVSEERSKRKTLKKHGDVDARKQKALRGEENEQQEPLQKKREDEVKEKGKKVLELKNLLEQQQVEKAKERDPKLRGKEKPPQAQLEPAALADRTTKEADGQQQLGEEKKPKPPAAASAAPGTWLSKAVKFQKSLSTSCLVPPKGVQRPGSPSADENDYGLDLNSDDSTDDENDPRKPVPAWADGAQLHQAVLHQYYHPVDVDALFGAIPSPQLEHIFYKSKPRYFKRTSSAVWHSPPGPSPSCVPQS